MDEIRIKADKRSIVGKQTKNLRKEGILPAVVYSSSKDSENVQINAIEFQKAFAKGGHSTLISIELEGETFKALIDEVQRNPRTGSFSHVMINKVNLKEEITAEVPFEIIGESLGVKVEKGILVTPLNVLEIRCLPTDLPSKIVVDISSLNSIGDSLTVADINLPTGVKLLHEDSLNATVVAITAPQLEEVVETAELSPEDVELSVEKGKKEEVTEEKK